MDETPSPFCQLFSRVFGGFGRDVLEWSAGACIFVVQALYRWMGGQALRTVPDWEYWIFAVIITVVIVFIIKFYRSADSLIREKDEKINGLNDYITKRESIVFDIFYDAEDHTGTYWDERIHDDPKYGPPYPICRYRVKVKNISHKTVEGVSVKRTTFNGISTFLKRNETGQEIFSLHPQEEVLIDVYEYDTINEEFTVDSGDAPAVRNYEIQVTGKNVQTLHKKFKIDCQNEPCFSLVN